MAKEGFHQDFDFNIDNLMDKTFHTYRKSKTNSTKVHWKWNPFNLVNRHFMRNGDYVFDVMQESDVPKKIYQARPNLVLNIGNEYLAMLMMDQLREYYTNSSLTMPQRHLFTRFVRDFKEFTLDKIDWCHYTVPLNTANANGFVFPSEYVGQYGVYEAVKHVYESTPSMTHLVKEDSLMTNTRYFAADMEKAVEGLRHKFRESNNISANAHAIFIAPGNEKSEAEFCMENLRKGVKEFLLKYSAPTSMSPKALPL
jgi:hypothetical protein